MHIVNSALVQAAEQAAEHGDQVSPYVFGAVAFGTLVLLLIVTLMIKVED